MEKDWRKLEKLLFEYVNASLKGEKILYREITKSSHDCGYDATWLIVPKNELQVQNILMESKYRTTENSLPLTDCAKAIIISFNIGANKLYIGTNIVFSPQAAIEAEKFKKRSNLDIEFIDGCDLRTFISNNKMFLEKCLGKRFLQKIINSTASLKRTSSIAKSVQTPYSFDEKRQQIIDRVTKSFLYSSCTNIISGLEGIGKSLVCNRILNEIEKNGYAYSKIDLSLCTSTRILYINILEAIWGVKIREIILEQNIEDYIDTLISISKDFSNMDIPKAVKQILLCDTKKYNEYQDVFLHLLLLYINEILSIHKNDIQLVIMFENINTVSTEVVNFLIAIVKVLNKNNIRCLLEIRTPLLLLGSSPEESNYLFNEMIRIANFNPYCITELDKDECIKLIQKDINLNNNVCYILMKTLCYNPLELQCATNLLKNKSLREIEYINQLTENELIDYLDNEQIAINNLVVSLINSLRISVDFNKLFELTILFNGVIDSEVLNEIFNNNIIDIAEKSSLYEFSYGFLRCKHLRYIHAMKKTSNKLINYDVAKKVIEYMNRCNKQYDDFIELELMYSVNDLKQIPYKIIKISEFLSLTHQHNDIIHMISRYFEKCNYIFQNNSVQEIHIIILLKLLQCISETHTGNISKNSLYYEYAEKMVKEFNSKLYQNKYWVEYQLLLWDKYFTFGNYFASLKIAKDLYLNIDKVCLLFDENFDCPGRIYTAYGLSNKSIGSGMSANNIFIEGIEKFPNSFFCKASLLSHEGNYYLKHNPTLALEKYSSLLRTTENKQYPYREILHTRIDISMAYFLCGNYQESKKKAIECIGISDPISAFSQKGRALNILACCNSIERNNKEAIQCIEESIKVLKYSNTNIYCWRAQLNYASILLYENSKSEQAYEQLYEIYDFLKSTNYNKIINDKDSVSHQCILLILLYLNLGNKIKMVEKILLDFENTTILEEYKLLKHNHWQNYFSGKVKYINGIVYVMG